MLAEAIRHLCGACDHLVEGILQVKTGCPLCQAWSHLVVVTWKFRAVTNWAGIGALSKSYKAQWLLLISGLWTFERFGENLQHELRQTACMNGLLEEALSRHVS